MYGFKGDLPTQQRHRSRGWKTRVQACSCWPILHCAGHNHYDNYPPLTEGPPPPTHRRHPEISRVVLKFFSVEDFGVINSACTPPKNRGFTPHVCFLCSFELWLSQELLVLTSVAYLSCSHGGEQNVVLTQTLTLTFFFLIEQPVLTTACCVFILFNLAGNEIRASRGSGRNRAT